jgi:hypothetical protein
MLRKSVGRGAALAYPRLTEFVGVGCCKTPCTCSDLETSSPRWGADVQTLLIVHTDRAH